MSDIVALEQEQVKWVKIGLQGKQGVGKTFLLGTKEQNQSMLIINEHAGVNTLKSSYNFAEIPKYIKVTSIETITDLVKLSVKLRKKMEGKLDWIVIDCFTNIAKLFFDNCQKENPAVKDKRNFYGIAQAECLQALSIFTKESYPFNVIITFHPKFDDDGMKIPDLIGQALGNVGGMFDVFGHMKIKNKKRMITFKHTRESYGKDRSGALPDECEPDLEFIADTYFSAFE